MIGEATNKPWPPWSENLSIPNKETFINIYISMPVSSTQEKWVIKGKPGLTRQKHKGSARGGGRETKQGDGWELGKRAMNQIVKRFAWHPAFVWVRGLIRDAVHSLPPREGQAEHINYTGWNVYLLWSSWELWRVWAQKSGKPRREVWKLKGECNLHTLITHPAFVIEIFLR